ncbi:unknown [Roseburia sp. CAG:303]|nr:unknown [Roseburia sp. CAG:303]
MKNPISDISVLFRIMETLENSADNTASITIFKKADL